MKDGFDWPCFLAEFATVAEARGFERTVLLETAAGPMTAWERLADGPRVYVSSGIHGDEPAGPLALLELMKRDFFARNVSWAVCPALNPTGLALGTRENSGGVDLNRDYWKQSTEEVKAHATWLEDGRIPELFLSLHEDWEAGNFYLYEINLGADDPGRSAAIIAAVEPWFPPESGPDIDGHEPRGPGWIFHAAEADLPEHWPEAIFMSKHGCPLSFTFETPSHAALDARVVAHCAAVRTACRHLTDQISER